MRLRRRDTIQPSVPRSTVGTTAPVDDLSLVNLVPVVIRRGETWRRADRAVDVDQPVTVATDEVVVIVVRAVLVASWRASGLDSPDEPVVDEDAERVVDRLARDCAKLESDEFGEVVRGRVWSFRHGTQHREPLCRDVDATFAKLVNGRQSHQNRLLPYLDSVQNPPSARLKTGA